MLPYSPYKQIYITYFMEYITLRLDSCVGLYFTYILYFTLFL